MKYSQFDPYQMKNHRIIWSCNFEPTNAKEAAKYSCTPIKGMLTINDDLETERGDNPTHDGFYTTPRYFVPFKKNAKGCDLEDLAWSKAVIFVPVFTLTQKLNVLKHTMTSSCETSSI